jgi:hypothetical protein
MQWEFLKPLHVCLWQFTYFFMAIWLVHFWSYFPFWLRILYKKVCMCNLYYILSKNSSNFSCLLIALWRIAYYCNTSIGSFLKELFPLAFLHIKYFFKNFVLCNYSYILNGKSSKLSMHAHYHMQSYAFFT